MRLYYIDDHDPYVDDGTQCGVLKMVQPLNLNDT